MRVPRSLGLSLAALPLLACSLATRLAPPPTAATPAWWQPPVALTWQWQLSDLPADLSLAVDMYDLDLFDTDAAQVAALQAAGRHVVCYISVGSWEDWRPDAEQFPAAVIGAPYEGWPGEYWLDIRQIDQLAPVLGARLDLCAAKGFDGVEPDNIDGYTNATGFAPSAADQLAFNRWLAAEAHARGLSIGLKNDPEQVADLLPFFDWALTEDCLAEGWCAELQPFIAAGKPVFAAEYTDNDISAAQLCAAAEEFGFAFILKHRELDAWRASCP